MRAMSVVAPEEDDPIMKKLLSLAFSAALTAGAAWAAVGPEPGKTQWTGYITDTHCGEKGANKNHTAECIDKCMKGGSKAQIKNESDGNVYNLKDFDPSVRALVGKRVTVTGTLDAPTKTITVQHAKVANVAP
jgi:hypothetical protein